VAESAAISSPDPKRGEVIKAFVVLTYEYSQRTKQDLDALINKLQGFCKSNADPYKYPREIQFVDSDILPKTISGKFQRNVLRKMGWKDGRPKIGQICTWNTSTTVHKMRLLMLRRKCEFWRKNNYSNNRGSVIPTFELFCWNICALLDGNSLT
jgi:hypothetical protein